MERFRQFRAAAVVAASVVLATGGTARAVDGTEATGPADGVRLGGRWFAEPVRRAVHGARRRLAEPSCAAVLGDFRDPAGRALAHRLDELSLDPDAYARLVLFYDGSNDAPCRRPRVYAFTTPGSRVVRVCPTLGALADSRPDEAAAVVIHEMLHTLGLAHDQPSSAWITSAVENRCRRAEERPHAREAGPIARR